MTTSVPFEIAATGSDTSQHRHLAVRGPVDATTIDQFARTLDHASHGGVVPLTVDVGEVTLLSSVALRALFELASQLERHGHHLTIIAARTSPASAVLDLVGLAHRAPEAENL